MLPPLPELQAIAAKYPPKKDKSKFMKVNKYKPASQNALFLQQLVRYHPSSIGLDAVMSGNRKRATQSVVRKGVLTLLHPTEPEW